MMFRLDVKRVLDRQLSQMSLACEWEQKFDLSMPYLGDLSMQYE